MSSSNSVEDFIPHPPCARCGSSDVKFRSRRAKICKECSPKVKAAQKEERRIYYKALARARRRLIETYPLVWKRYLAEEILKARRGRSKEQEDEALAS